MSNWASKLGITSTTTFHILHEHTATSVPHALHHSTSHHNISHLTLHDITASHHWCRTYSTLHLTGPHHSHRVNKVQHPTSGIAKRCTSHQIWHHALWSGGVEIREMWCDVEWCAVPKMWFDGNIELWWWDLNVSVTYCHCGISHLVTSFHHILHCIIWPSPRHTATFHVTPSFLTISPISYHTSTSRSTLFHFAIPYLKSHHWYRQHYASRHISHCIPFYITFHITPHSMYSTPHLRSRHILATLCITPPHLTITPHFTQLT